MRYTFLLTGTALLCLLTNAQDDASGTPAGDIGDIVCATATQEVSHMPYPGDGTKWIKCDTENGGTAIVYTCDEGLLFSFEVQACVWPDQSEDMAGF